METLIKDTEDYAEIRLEEAYVKLKLAVELLRMGYSRPAAEKTFMAWESIASVLVYKNLGQMYRNEEERKWYSKIGFLVPRRYLNRIARRLEEIGYENITGLNAIAQKLYRYALFFGANQFCNYLSKEDAIEDLKIAIKKLAKILIKEGKEEKGEEILSKLENVDKILKME